jgi:hypothetical protein
MSIKTIKWGVGAFACVAILASAACTKDNSSPTGPSTSTPAPAPVVPGTARVVIAVNPNPVAFSGQPVTDAGGCAGVPNTWFYSQNLTESNGVAVTFTSRIDKFDERVVNSLTNQNFAVPAMGTLALQSRWCSSQAVAHTAQSSFSGTDANGHTVNIDGPVVNLKSP